MLFILLREVKSDVYANHGWTPFLPHFLCPVVLHYTCPDPFLTSQQSVAARTHKNTILSGPRRIAGRKPSIPTSLSYLQDL